MSLVNGHYKERILVYPRVITVPSSLLLSEVQALQGAMQMQTLPPNGQPMTLREQRNSRWRKVAEYDKWVMPLYLYLESIDWQKVADWYADLWHRQFVRSFHYYKEEWGGYYRGGMYRNSKKPGGRLIQRDRLLAGKFRLKLTLPIPTPLEYAQRRIIEELDLYRGVLAKSDTEAKLSTPDERKYLADRLKTASRHLGRIEKANWNTSSTWKPDWQLEQAVEPEGDGRRFQSLQPSSLGQLLAMVEHFWLCWYDFHTVEKEALTQSAAVRLASPPALITASSSLAHLHPTIQQAAGSLYTTGHYRQALLDAFIAVDTAVRDKSQLAGSGTRLMETAFSPGNPVLKIGDSPDEQQGFMALFRGAMLAIRNPKAHSLNGTHDAQRALEWLNFASVLLRNLDEAILVQLPPMQ
jgi:uncharacterized protein (TIGR02391 family)